LQLVCGDPAVCRRRGYGYVDICCSRQLLWGA